MSETTEQPITGEGAAAPEPADTETEAPQPAPEQAAEPDKQPEPKLRSDKRIAELSARLDAAERERQRQAAELELYRRQVQPQADETPEQREARTRAEIRAQVEQDLRRERFHAEGTAAHADWSHRCEDLMQMGADPGFAALLVEMPDGVKVTAALAEDPTEVQRIANIRTERGRAIALGKYAAGLEREAGTARPATRQVTAAPPPIRPVQGRTQPTFDPYNPDLKGEQLIDYFRRQDAEKRARH